jgi:hypothetical protein
MVQEMFMELRSGNLKLDKTTAKPYITNDGEFERDDAKAAENEAKHGVTFDMARDVFRDPFAAEWLDTSRDYGEDRFVTIGMVEGRLLTVVFTLRVQTIRIISARRAEPYERRRYHEKDEA